MTYVRQPRRSVDTLRHTPSQGPITPTTTRPIITHQNHHTHSVETHPSETGAKAHPTRTASTTPTQRVQTSATHTPQRPPPQLPTRRTRSGRGTRTKHTLPHPKHTPCNHASWGSRNRPSRLRSYRQQGHVDTHVARPGIEHMGSWECRDTRPCCRHNRTHSTHAADATAPRPRTLAASGAATGANTGCASAAQRCRAATA